MEKKDYLRNLTSVNDLIQAVYRSRALGKGMPRELVTEASRTVLDGVRGAILAARDEMSLKEIKTDTEELVSLVEKEVEEKVRTSLRRVINATGVVIHTNMGRSILSREAMQAVEAAASYYDNLEFDLETGSRGSRQMHLEKLLRELTGAEAALVVNNNAAAVLLALAALARGKEVIVSRGQLIEIGGSFRLPDVMAESGARLVEVGSTNKTYLDDYRAAISSETAMLLRAHTSNYRIIGFTSEVGLKELAGLAGEFGLVLLDDLGSGAYMDFAKYGMPAEPTIGHSLEEGADLVCFSGDKLLGGPQSGITLGKEDLIEKMAKHPLSRALRIDKLSIAALEATLRLYLDTDNVIEKIPTLAMLSAEPEVLKKKARALARRIASETTSISAEVASDISRAGGGSFPLAEFPTSVVALTSTKLNAASLQSALREADPPIIARIKDDRVILDMRTVREDEVTLIAEALRIIDGGGGAEERE
ncbi:MAG: L-seryl-tRNA(Sec) selenium transferase [Candidatus Solincola sediminis]|uniref:L-seryl-tRNA(Sec) selenium transferase n=1 Tax=Candidatus Solincola sediminis TaxID=1797199 RepID=A0A1F2WEY7_9ACTN|nr:MAG: L-seryl-tRNA(Sec) selenium transferase [Candidatus Solincola sediminis]OFW59138.1 MAG: L-seryl-tRNA(Sec) selenium transferase [Candidatus Solincola sediminis]